MDKREILLRLVTSKGGKKEGTSTPNVIDWRFRRGKEKIGGGQDKVCEMIR